MPVTDLPLFSMLRTRMHWHEERQRVLSENIANADTPGFKPKDLAPVDFRGMVQSSMGLARTEAGHLGGLSGGDSTHFKKASGGRFEVRPAGNAVNLEDEMMKVAQNQMDHQAATSLYTRSMAMFRTAIGRKA